MVNLEHLSILTQGADLWNFWRNESGIKHADLSDADLSNTNLEGVDLTACDCSGASFSSAFLVSAILIEADFSASDFSGANLTSAYLNEANLIGANLTRAVLTSTNFHSADVRYAKFRFATVAGVCYTNLDLSLTHGLDSCVHISPSHIDQQTLTKSGKLPRVFLEGIGLMKWEIDNNKLSKSRLKNQ
ncbi:MAG: pentapeptide repeat-containing protein [Deinococcota bacterium]